MFGTREWHDTQTLKYELEEYDKYDNNKKGDKYDEYEVNHARMPATVGRTGAGQDVHKCYLSLSSS